MREYGIDGAEPATSRYHLTRGGRKVAPTLAAPLPIPSRKDAAHSKTDGNKTDENDQGVIENDEEEPDLITERNPGVENFCRSSFENGYSPEFIKGVDPTLVHELWAEYQQACVAAAT